MNTIKLLLISGILILPTIAWSQENQITQDPAAGEILDKVAEKTKLMKSIQADFELVIEDKKEKTKNSSFGTLLVKQNKYKIISQESTVLYDGKTMWTYTPDNKEVTITEPNNKGSEFLSDPASIFTFYNRDFKYRYIRETVLSGSRCHEIDLYPKNLNQPYIRIKIFISVKNEMPEIISSIGKDGVDHTVYLKNFVFDREINDATFAFDPAKFKKVEVIDMRGVE